MIAEYENGEVVREYAWDERYLLGVLNEGYIFMAATDHLGTPRALVGSDQSISWRWANQSFYGKNEANEQVRGGLGPNIVMPLRFPGQYFDKESGLHYNWNRYYDPQKGRYIQADPIGLAGGWNPYAYANGNPVNYTDSLGLWAWGISLGGAFALPGNAGGSFSYTASFDHTGNFSIVRTIQVGAATPGANAFGRLLLGNKSFTNKHLVGFSASADLDALKVSTSTTIPVPSLIEPNAREEKLCGPPPMAVEVGRNIGFPGLSATADIGSPVFESNLLGDIGRSIGSFVYDVVN